MPEATATVDLVRMLQEGAAKGASDLHLAVGFKPTLRISKDLIPLNLPPLHGRSVDDLMASHLTEDQKQKFKREARLNCALSIPGLGRFRVNLYRSKGEAGAAIRILTMPIRPIQDIGLPPTILPVFHRGHGIIIVTGATGSGKSSTLASIVDFVNKGQIAKKVITIEDPIEYEYPTASGLIIQREVGFDTPSFQEGMMDALRQDPNIVVIGELRDAESILTGLLAAETGHMVLTTLHTPDAPSTISRMIGAVPPAQQELVRSLLGGSIQAVIAQELLQRADKKGVVLAVEVMVATEAVRRLIRENKPEQIYDLIQTGTNVGMLSKDQCLVGLFKKGLITKEVALSRMRNPQMLGV